MQEEEEEEGEGDTPKNEGALTRGPAEQCFRNGGSARMSVYSEL